MLALALALDAVFGEPDWLWRRLPHPAVLFGRLIAWLEARLNQGSARRARGVLGLCVLLIVVLVPALALSHPVLVGVGQVIGAAILLAQQSLVSHVRAVAAALDEGLAPARQAVAMIVGRDPATLDEAGVARAAIESAAENFSDAVVAPAFWFAVAGLPGIVLYKAVNTADSMIGYRSERYREYGWAAARLDDALNLIPARLSGLILCAVGPGSLKVLWRDARLHASPNAGWPEAATASALDVALAGPRIYDGTRLEAPYVFAEGRRAPTARDIEAACRLLWRGWALVLVAALLLEVPGFLHFFGG
ncbi:MAG: adenosylcobinamide-phosphate synthase CbiB [Pseudomonadota bacterium]